MTKVSEKPGQGRKKCPGDCGLYIGVRAAICETCPKTGLPPNNYNEYATSAFQQDQTKRKIELLQKQEVKLTLINQNIREILSSEDSPENQLQKLVDSYKEDQSPGVLERSREYQNIFPPGRIATEKTVTPTGTNYSKKVIKKIKPDLIDKLKKANVRSILHLILIEFGYGNAGIQQLRDMISTERSKRKKMKDKV